MRHILNIKATQEHQSMQALWLPSPIALLILAVLGVFTQTGQAQTELPLPKQANKPGRVNPAEIDPPAGPIILEGPKQANSTAPTEFKQDNNPTDTSPISINLPTALMLSDARPLIVDAAKAAEAVAAAEYEKAHVLWLPNIYAGIDYYRHDGLYPAPSSGYPYNNSRQSITLGPGVQAIFATTDAIYTPLATKQVLRAKRMEVQAAKNDALMEVAVAYFNVQQARGRMAGAVDTVFKGRELVRRVESLGLGLSAPIETDRARTLLADLEEVAVKAREDWLVSSAELARLLRLNPSANMVPTEPPHMATLLISPGQEVDNLIPVGLTNRPELGASQAMVQATLVRLKQEKMRPLIPSLVLQGNSGANGNGNPLIAGAAGSGPNSSMEMGSRFDINAAVLWELKNFGLGNRALIKERGAQRYQALIELFQIQDRVAAEVSKNHAQLRSATVRVGLADTGLRNAITSFEGNLKGMGQTTRFGDVLNLVNRPQEVVAALGQLDGAYKNYFQAVQDYNRAQFSLFRSVGYPAEVLACQRVGGNIIDVDTNRPFDLPPVTGIPCANQMCTVATELQVLPSIP
jgi:outer membrane protein TolC